MKYKKGKDFLNKKEKVFPPLFSEHFGNSLYSGFQNLSLEFSKHLKDPG